jgi:flagellar biosynthetic protein FlhB
LAVADNDQEKTEQPTSRRLEEARQEGRFAVSKELSSFLMLLGALAVFYFLGLWMFSGMADIMKGSMSLFKGELSPKDFRDILTHASWRFLLLISPALAIPVIGALSYLMQNGFAFTGKPLEPDFSRINPISGVQRLFSLHSVVELFKAIVKIAVLGYVVYGAVKKEWMNMPFLADMDSASSIAYMARTSLMIMVRTSWVIAVIAALDYMYQRWEFQRGLRMTREEIKEEMREMEGDPTVKARIKSIQREMARKRMMQEVPKADLVVTNPTHIAVALKYDRKEAPAPLVVAKGSGLIAEKIREIAKRHNVPVIENKPVARALYKLVEVGMQIPVDMYKAVAEMLAYVYRLRKRAV